MQALGHHFNNRSPAPLFSGRIIGVKIFQWAANMGGISMWSLTFMKFVQICGVVGPYTTSFG